MRQISVPPPAIAQIGTCYENILCISDNVQARWKRPKAQNSPIKTNDNRWLPDEERKSIQNKEHDSWKP